MKEEVAEKDSEVPKALKKMCEGLLTDMHQGAQGSLINSPEGLVPVMRE